MLGTFECYCKIDLLIIYFLPKTYGINIKDNLSKIHITVNRISVCGKKWMLVFSIVKEQTDSSSQQENHLNKICYFAYSG